MRLAQERRLLAITLDQVDVRAGVPASAQANTTPGKPPPLPRSAQTFAPAQAQKLQRIKMPGPQIEFVERGDEIGLGLPSRRSATK